MCVRRFHHGHTGDLRDSLQQGWRDRAENLSPVPFRRGSTGSRVGRYHRDGRGFASRPWLKSVVRFAGREADFHFCTTLLRQVSGLRPFRPNGRKRNGSEVDDAKVRQAKRVPRESGILVT